MNAVGEWVTAHPRAARGILLLLGAVCFEAGYRFWALADDIRTIHSDAARAASEALGG